MIIALDIETVGNAEIIPMLPEPSIDSRLKDPAKIADAKAGAKQKQIDGMALDPLTARVICFAAVGLAGETVSESVEIVPDLTDVAESALLQSIMRFIGTEEVRLVTWNGIGFDLPMIYKRAMILGVDPSNFGAPPLTAWTKRYSADRHYDLMQIWGGWSTEGREKLETVAGMVLHEKRADIPYDQMPELMKAEEGRKLIADGCLNHTRLTWRLWEKFNGFLFA